MPRAALILSSGRTGTKFLARYLDANYPEVVARHEPPPSRLLRLASHAHLAGHLRRDTLAALLRRARRGSVARATRAGAVLYVESNPFLAGFVEVLDAAFEDPVVVHVVRDPRDHARSSLAHGTGSGWKGLANRAVPFWYPDVRRILGLDHPPSWLERAAGVWEIFNRRLSEAGPRYPGYHLVRYEELFDARHSGLRALCAALDLRYRERELAVAPDERVNPGSRDVLPAWPGWTRDQCRALHRICGPRMRAYGYGGEPEWRERLGEHAEPDRGRRDG